MNNITIELCQEDRARLDAIIEGIKQKPRCDSCVETVRALSERLAEYTKNEAQSTEEAPTPTNTPPVEEKPTVAEILQPEKAEEETPAEPEPKTKYVLPSDLQAEIIRLSRKGFRDQVKEIVFSYNVTSASQIPEEKRAEALEKIRALEG